MEGKVIQQRQSKEFSEEQHGEESCCICHRKMEEYTREVTQEIHKWTPSVVFFPYHKAASEGVIGSRKERVGEGLLNSTPPC